MVHFFLDSRFAGMTYFCQLNLNLELEFLCATVMCMKLKRYKPLILQVGILLLLVSLALFILEQQKKFITIDFSKHYYPNKTIELTGFEEGEQWRGNYSYDSERVLEGRSSITFSSWYGIKNVITNEESIPIPSGYAKGYISLFVPDKKKLESMEVFQLILSENPENMKVFDLTQQLNVGWNRIPVVIPDWKKITTLTFNITSKKDEITEVNLDRFWIENTSVYTSDIINSNSRSISLKTIGERTYIFYSSPTEESFIFNSPQSINGGSVTISLIPEHAKNVVMAVNSTSMGIGGKNMSQCTLYEKSTTISEKMMKTTSANDNLYVFLKADIKNNAVAYSLSNNGIDFESCGVAKASEKKPIQLSLDGSYLIDSYSVEY